MTIERYSLPYSEPSVEDLHRRLDQIRWPDEVIEPSSDYGIDSTTVRDLCRYWRNTFNWEAQLSSLSKFSHFKFVFDGFGIHFVHERGKGRNPLPLIITHGWPGSFLEMLKIIPMLTDPVRYGGDEADSFNVVIPSLPGYGFSDRPLHRGMNSFVIATLWVALMRELGYDQFGTQGGDIGAGVSTVLGWKHPEHVLGIHVNYIPGSFRPHLGPDTQLSGHEEEFLTVIARWRDEEGAYSHVQSTRPLTAAYGLNDSPAGLAAWILEKFRDWADCKGDLESIFSRDELLTNITLYWMTQTIHSSFRLYYENRRAPLIFGAEDFVHKPCAVARFPKEIPCPPREWVSRGYNVQRWTEFPRGGHFAALEQPNMLAEDIRAFFRPLRADRQLGSMAPY